MTNNIILNLNFVQFLGTDIAAVGRRMFDEEEIFESEDDIRHIEDKTMPIKAKAKKKRKRKHNHKKAVPRYMQIFEKQVEEKAKDQKEEDYKTNLKLLKVKPREFGLWDDVSNAKRVMSSLEGQPLASRYTRPLSDFEAKVRTAQLEAEKRHVVEDKETDISDKSLVGGGRTSLKIHPTTGKYLHENDMIWCRRHTSMTNSVIIKWFKRFRRHCNYKGQLSGEGLAQIYQRIYEGRGDIFARIIFKWFGVNPLLDDGFLDFKVIKS